MTSRKFCSLTSNYFPELPLTNLKQTILAGPQPGTQIWWLTSWTSLRHDSEGLRRPTASCCLVFLFVLSSDKSGNEALLPIRVYAGNSEQTNRCLVEQLLLQVVFISVPSKGTSWFLLLLRWYLAGDTFPLGSPMQMLWSE